MTSPLALLVYENLMPGSQLVNRLQDLGYRVQTLNDARQLVATAESEKALVVIVDLRAKNSDVNEAIQNLKAHPATAHIPVIAFVDPKQTGPHAAAQAAGANLVASPATILQHLPQFLDQALELN
ncbi:MAG: hypothetical protein HY043_05965 [Verrucomicrobia bacterium]|nr:hypothetical protein [Verrucomicrobiota bacterium]